MIGILIIIAIVFIAFFVSGLFGAICFAELVRRNESQYRKGRK